MITKDLGMVTAYAYAVAGGYTGTEAEFTQLMADLAVVVDDFDNFSVNVTTLPAGSSATASYADGVLSLGIPKGDKGDKGDTGETGAPAGFGTVSATVDDSIGTPSVEVTASGADTAKNFAFAFHNLKGQKGDKGDTGEVSEAELAETLEAYAKIDGYYSNLTAGSAEQLLSTVTIEDEVPYLFRTSGGSIEIGDRETDCVVGGSVAWNQRGKEFNSTNWYTEGGVAVTYNNGEVVMKSTTANNGIYSAASLYAKHVYLGSMTFKCPNYASGDQVRMYIGSSNGVIGTFEASADYKKINLLGKATTGVTDRLYITAYSNGILNKDIYVKNFAVFDLTQMFGSTIADAIYAMEQSTAGAGVAWFRKLFPKPYYAYNAGELLSVSGVSAHNMTGFNQWDEEWEVGSISSSNGNDTPSTGTIRSKNYVPVISGQTYNFYCASDIGFYIYAYDRDKNYIQYWSKSTIIGTLLTIPDGVAYIRFRMFDPNYGGTYKNDICINLSWDGERNGEYEPYVKHSYALDDSLTLRGIPKLDSANSLYYDGDTYESDGTVTRKYGVYTFTGSETWTPNGSNSYNANGINLGRKKSSDYWSGVGNFICEGLVSTSNSKIYNGTESGAVMAFTDSTSMDGLTISKYVYDNRATLLTGKTLVYELAEPTEESADPYTNPQIVDDFGTEEYVSTSIVPVGHKTQYMPNLRAKLEMAPDSPNGDGDYIVRQTNGTNEYVLMANNATIQNIISRLEALEGQNG